MTGPSFTEIGPFQADMPWGARAEAVRDLMKACEPYRTETRAAMCLLGDPHNRERRAQALGILNSLGSLPIRRILHRFNTAQLRRQIAQPEPAVTQ